MRLDLHFSGCLKQELAQGVILRIVFSVTLLPIQFHDFANLFVRQVQGILV